MSCWYANCCICAGVRPGFCVLGDTFAPRLSKGSNDPAAAAGEVAFDCVAVARAGVSAAAGLAFMKPNADPLPTGAASTAVAAGVGVLLTVMSPNMSVPPVGDNADATVAGVDGGGGGGGGPGGAAFCSFVVNPPKRESAGG